jgi:hypothetical protein
MISVLSASLLSPAIAAAQRENKRKAILMSLAAVERQ